LIAVAKRAQLQRDPGSGRLVSPAELLLNHLEAANRAHIHAYVQHTMQQQQLAAQADAQRHLVQMEQRLQDELHIDQAIQGGKKFILISDKIIIFFVY
jgi:hypothetical protein